MIVNDYVPYVELITTEDIYHEVGKIICRSLEDIRGVRYTKVQISKEESIELLERVGYRRIDGTKTWVREAPRVKRKAYVAPLINVYAF